MIRVYIPKFLPDAKFFLFIVSKDDKNVGIFKIDGEIKINE